MEASLQTQFPLILHNQQRHILITEYLEAPLVKSGQDRMKELETMMRIDLRDKISNNASASEVSQQVDAIILKMDTQKLFQNLVQLQL